MQGTPQNQRFSAVGVLESATFVLATARQFRVSRTGWKVVAASLPDNWNHFWPILQWAPTWRRDRYITVICGTDFSMRACACLYTGIVRKELFLWICQRSAHFKFVPSTQTCMHACMWICQHGAHFKFVPSTQTCMHAHSHAIWGPQTDWDKSGYCHSSLVPTVDANASVCPQPRAGPAMCLQGHTSDSGLFSL